MGLAKDVLGVKLESFLGAGLDTKGFAIAQITLEGMLYILVEEHSAEGAACQALVTGDALLLVQPDNAVLLVNGIGRAAFTALRHAALLADDGHPYHGVWIEDHDPHAALLGVVDVLPADAAGQFTDFTPGTALRDNGKMHGLPPVDLRSVLKSSYK